MKELQTLEELQTIDLALDELKAKLVDSSELRELKLLQKKLVALQNELRDQSEVFKENELKQKKLEGEIEMLDLKIKREEKRLFSGTVVHPKELSSIQAEVKMLSKRKDELETELLEQLDVVELAKKAVQAGTERLNKLTKEAQAAEEKYQRMIKGSQVKIEELEAKRPDVESKISSELLSKYHRLREGRISRAVVSLLDETCQGCFVTLPTEEADKMLSEDRIWHCPNCRRILIIKK